MFLFVKFTCTDLDLFNLIRHFRVQSWILLTAICSFSVASSLVFPTAKMAVLSAKVAMVSFSRVGISHVYKRYRNGPKTLPCGTPAVIAFSSE